MAKTGFIQVDEGCLFWRADYPLQHHHSHSDQSGARLPPVLLFIHVISFSDLLHPLWSPYFLLVSRDNFEEQVHFFCSSNQSPTSSTCLKKKAGF